MEIGAAALALRQRGYPWHVIGAALGGYNSMSVRRLAGQYLMRETLQDLAARSDRSARPSAASAPMLGRAQQRQELLELDCAGADRA